MIEPWFDPIAWSWLPATLIGVSMGFLGGVAGTVASFGKARTPILATSWVFEVLSIGLFAAGVVALALGQPHGVWYGLLHAGCIGMLGSTILVLGLPWAYRQAEERAKGAAD